MSRKDYRTIHVSDDVYSYLQKQSKETDHSIPEYITHLIEKNKLTKGGK